MIPLQINFDELQNFVATIQMLKLEKMIRKSVALEF